MTNSTAFRTQTIADLGQALVDLVECGSNPDDYNRIVKYINLKTIEMTEGLSEEEKLFLLQLSILCEREVSLKELYFVFTEPGKGEKFEARLEALLIRKVADLVENHSIRVNPVVGVAIRELIKPTQRNCAILVIGLVDKLDRMITEMPELTSVQGEYLSLLETIAKHFHEPTEALVRLHTKIGTIYSSWRDYYPAIDALKKAVSIAERVHGLDASEMAYTCNELSAAYQDLGDLLEALIWQKKCTAAIEKLPVNNDIWYATYYHNLSCIYRELGELSLALATEHKSLFISEELLELNDPALAKTYSSLGFLYSQAGQTKKAIEWTQKAVDVLRRNFPQGDPELTAALDALKQLESLN